jgi:hypothetical protein
MARGGNRIGAGRPKGRTNRRPTGGVRLHLIAQQYTPEAIETLREVMHSGSASARVAAACAILDRGYGRPPAQIDIIKRSELSVVYRSAAEIRQALIDRGIPPALLPPPSLRGEEDDDRPATAEKADERGD